MISIIDYGMGNCGSILNMLRRIGAEAALVSTPDGIGRARKLILPGVGAFDNGIARLRQLGLLAPLQDKVMVEHTPILGICLGLQLFCDGSDEGRERGLGWIRGRARKFEFSGEMARIRVPQMGWNTLELKRSHPVFTGLDADARFYFVHSYYVRCVDPEDVLATAEYGGEFVAAVARGLILGVQFHPEKSLRWGMQVLRRFVENVPETAAEGHPLPVAAEYRPG